jgi:hypothetical protein
MFSVESGKSKGGLGGDLGIGHVRAKAYTQYNARLARHPKAEPSN